MIIICLQRKQQPFVETGPSKAWINNLNMEKMISPEFVQKPLTHSQKGCREPGEMTEKKNKKRKEAQ
jgi:hypothetical protein